jgi:hypothetical protein
MAVPVNLYVADSTPSALPVAGVAVGIYDPTSLVQVAYGLSDAAGRTAFLLPGLADGQSYEARFFKIGYLFTNPQLIKVYEPTNDALPNGFYATATQLGVFGAPIDPRVCRCVGRFLNYQNQPVANALVRLSSDADLRKKTPEMVDGNAVTPASLEARTDPNGFVVLDLLRTGEYFITFAGEDDETWNFKVPDRPTANLFDLIHPYPISLVWGGSVTTLSMKPGDITQVDVTVLFSDYVSRSKQLHDIICFTSSDQTLADVAYLGHLGQLGITARAEGVVTVTAGVAPGLYPHRVPDYSISAPVLTVTIAP